MTHILYYLYMMDITLPLITSLVLITGIASIVLNGEPAIERDILYLQQQVSALKNESEILRVENTLLKQRIDELYVSQGRLLLYTRFKRIFNNTN